MTRLIHIIESILALVRPSQRAEYKARQRRQYAAMKREAPLLNRERN